MDTELREVYKEPGILAEVKKSRVRCAGILQGCLRIKFQKCFPMTTKREEITRKADEEVVETPRRTSGE